MTRASLGFLRSLPALARWLFAAPIAICAGVLTTTPASAASLAGPISGWEVGTEPSWVSMYQYVPDNVAANPPVLLVVHFCSGNAAGVFNQARDGGMVAAADQYGFIMVLPQTTRNCWDVATTPALTHDGGGDTGAIVHQVQYAIANYGANPDRVYVTGTSSGAMVTQAILAAYPDVFKGGAAFAGVPAGCWSVNNPEGQWSAPCAGGEITHSAQEWGDMARAMYPGYSGFRPRLQLWHGDADSILSPVNHTEAIKQWTNVFGLDATPTMTTTVMIGDGAYTRDQWLDACGIPILDVWTQPGGPHGTDANMNGEHTIPFFALDQPASPDPQADCMGGSVGAGGGGAVPAAAGAGTVPDGTAGATTTGAMPTGAMPTGAMPTGAMPTGTTTTGAMATGTVSAPAADLPSRPTFACAVAASQRRAGTGAVAGLALLAFAFGRRQRRRTLCAAVAESFLGRHG